MLENVRSNATGLPTGGLEDVERWYVGEHCSAGCRVVAVEGAEVRALRTRSDDSLWSVTSRWPGSAMQEVAWSVLYDGTHDIALADDWCADFTLEVIARLPQETFCIALHEVLAWLYEDRPVCATNDVLDHAL
jgi:hypothetical protein